MTRFSNLPILKQKSLKFSYSFSVQSVNMVHALLGIDKNIIWGGRGLSKSQLGLLK